MKAGLRIAVAGGGLIGKRHLAALGAAGASIHSIVDPDPAVSGVAREYDVPLHTHLADALTDRPDGIVLATPNTAHEAGALECIAAGIPVLVEKPIATTVQSARTIVEAARNAGVAILTGHHRRHMPVIKMAREAVRTGRLGRVVAVHASYWIAKPDHYFKIGWRSREGAGPLLVNLVHDVDLLRFLLGEIECVVAVQSNQTRNHEIEDSCAAVLKFANGVLGTLQLSDTIVAPWSWEMTAHDNPAYPPTGENAMFIGGTAASIALPRGEIWSDGEKRDWWEPISRTTFPRAADDPLVAQMRNFMAVIRAEEEPVCSGEEGMLSLEALLAIRASAVSGKPVSLTQ